MSNQPIFSFSFRFKLVCVWVDELFCMDSVLVWRCGACYEVLQLRVIQTWAFSTVE